MSKNAIREQPQRPPLRLLSEGGSRNEYDEKYTRELFEYVEHPLYTRDDFDSRSVAANIST